jgi:hypothetical protein
MKPAKVSEQPGSADDGLGILLKARDVEIVSAFQLIMHDHD